MAPACTRPFAPVVVLSMGRLLGLALHATIDGALAPHLMLAVREAALRGAWAGRVRGSDRVCPSKLALPTMDSAALAIEIGNEVAR